MNYIRNKKVEDRYRDRVEVVSEDFFYNTVLEEEIFIRLQQAIDELPEKYRKVINLSLEGLSDKEVALRLGISIDAVKHARAAEPRRARSYRSRRGAEKENAPSGHEAFKAFHDGGFNDDLRLVSSSVKHNGMVLSQVAPLYTLERKCKSYQSMRKRTKRRRSVHFFLTG